MVFLQRFLWRDTMKQETMVYDFETGGYVTGKGAPVPIQLGFSPLGSSVGQVQSHYFSPELFVNPTTGKNYKQSEFMTKDANNKWQWTSEFAGAYGTHGIEASTFAPDSTVPNVHRTPASVGNLMQQFKGKQLYGFNSQAFDSFFFGRTIGVTDEPTRQATEIYAAQSAFKGKKGTQATTDVNKLITEKLGATGHGDVFKDLNELLFPGMSGQEAKQAARKQGLESTTNLSYAKFFQGAENIDESKAHDAAYDVWMTGKNIEGFQQLEQEVGSLRNALKAGDYETVHRMTSSETRSKLFALPGSFESEIHQAQAISGRADELSKLNPEELVTALQDEKNKKFKFLGNAPKDDIIEPTGKLTSGLFDKAKSAGKWLSELSGKKKIAGGVGLVAGLTAASTFTSSSNRSRNEEERKRRIVDQGVNGSNGEYLQY